MLAKSIRAITHETLVVVLAQDFRVEVFHQPRDVLIAQHRITLHDTEQFLRPQIEAARQRSREACFVRVKAACQLRAAQTLP
ncbi:hypothetical protein ASE57_05985 [Sphingomonas sp. Leaf11]|nr:hypothetical protein ASE58_05990 [Sphingomonas sp. Leaf9]KQM44228.1 hypothetical protein ASE57_05985 [Sphingomonas sp. Leaf11]